ncbi:Hypothetical protein R9X50_00753500 [Acrodontium crateriforme]|uniref:Uncharacterized protein n=1 Tax=Acrodontium crateriforme TaxID=150365 RepID=A0AAQ3MBM2_9PEZI|nr:Hypothetical protein R9X50_00753500 [Acrodontium crateriforme]
MKSLNAAVVLSCLLPSLVAGNQKDRPLQYANHLFNSIHSSMRQFGSSLNHNGMTLFMATVPEDTEFYHGTQSPYRVNGTEWLAFEPEHAMLFARARRGPPPDHRGPPRPVGTYDHADQPVELDFDDIESFDHGRPPAAPRRGHRNGGRQRWSLFNRDKHHELRGDSKQNPIMEPHDNDNDSHGYIHTYRTKHALRLLYLDGQSAAKSDKGTLDIQDLVLLHDNPPSVFAKPPGDSRGGGPMGESARAASLCNLAQERWGGRIDGILRMEGGFEIILCDFAKDLDIVRISQTQSNPNTQREDSFNYYQAVAARYDSIGGNRVTLNYEDFVSLFTNEEALSFDETNRPRVRNESTNAITNLRIQIDEMVFRHPNPDATNWQSIADMVVARYAHRIEYLASSEIKDIDLFKAEVDRALRPFIDHSARNRTTEIARCAAQFFPANATTSSTAARAIHGVTTTICKALSAASIIDTTAHGLSMMRALKDWLAWTEWKKCRGCASNEVCFLPIWPVGSASDFEKPVCRSDVMDAESDYWGGFGRPPRDGERD